MTVDSEEDAIKNVNKYLDINFGNEDPVTSISEAMFQMVEIAHGGDFVAWSGPIETPFAPRGVHELSQAMEEVDESELDKHLF